MKTRYFAVGLFFILCLSCICGIGFNAVDSTEVTADAVDSLTQRDLQKYVSDLKMAHPEKSQTQIQQEVLKEIGYNQEEIDLMSEEIKTDILDSKNVVFERIASNNNLNLSISFRQITLTLPINDNLPVDYYLAYALWTWQKPGCIGSPDFIGISLEPGKNYYSLAKLKSDSDLARYEFCRVHYVKEVYEGLSITKYPNMQAQTGEFYENNTVLTNKRVYAIDMPKDEIEYEAIGDPFVYKTIHTDFSGEAQFIIDINNNADESFSQLVAITYGHSIVEYHPTFVTNTSVSLGVGVSSSGANVGINFGTSDQTIFTQSSKIVTTMKSTTLSFNKIMLKNNKVYYLINLNSRRPLEYPFGETSNNTQLRLGDDVLIGDSISENLDNPYRQFKVEYNSLDNSVVIKPYLNQNKHLFFASGGYTVLNQYATFRAAGANLRVDAFKYYNAQIGLSISNVYRVKNGSDVMTYDNDFYSSVTWKADVEADVHKASWIFYEVPDDQLGVGAPTSENMIRGGDVCYIKNVASGKYWDVWNQSISNGGAIKQNIKNSPETYNQKFMLRAKNSGFEIHPYHVLGFRTDVTNASTASNTNIQIYAGNDSKAQIFRFLPVQKQGNKIRYMIATGVTNYTKTLQFPDSNYGTQLKQVDANMSDSKQWWEFEIVDYEGLVLDSNLEYYVRDAHSTYYMDIEGSQTKNGANVIQYNFSGANNQKFKFYLSSDGSYNLAPQHAKSKRFEIKKSAVYNTKGDKDGANLQLGESDGDVQQGFKFVRKSRESFDMLSRCSNYTCGIRPYDSQTMYQNLYQAKSYNPWSIERAVTEYENLFLNSTKRISINGTTEKIVYIKIPRSGSYTFETYGNLDTRLLIYLQTTTGESILKANVAAGGVGKNAKCSLSLQENDYLKIVVKGNTTNQNGNTALHVYR